jgi:hypothetical protein
MITQIKTIILKSTFFAFINIPGKSEMLQISPDPDVASQHYRLIIRYEGSIGYLAIKAE